MRSKADLLALAERVEREEPSEALDAAIAHAVGQQWTHPMMEVDPDFGPIRAPRFCSSLDAAVGLVPSGWTTDITDWDDPAGSWECTLSHPLLPLKAVGCAPTEPRARTAAALRAIAQEAANG